MALQQDQQAQVPEPFEGMQFSSYEPLEKADKRAQCPHCKKHRKFFCYDCVVPLTALPPRPITLPIMADIVHHPTENRSKSTSVHGAILSPGFVKVVEFTPEIMQQQTFDLSTTVLLYPSARSISVKDIPRVELEKITKVVLVDSQWQKANSILRHEKIAAIRAVHITTARTAFWRYQSLGSDHLSTVEALYWFMREFHEAKTGKKYDGEFDDLLWYFSYQYRLIQDYYKTNPNLKFNHIPDYISY